MCGEGVEWGWCHMKVFYSCLQDQKNLKILFKIKKLKKILRDLI
jgi:hypothetical protein